MLILIKNLINPNNPNLHNNKFNLQNHLKIHLKHNLKMNKKYHNNKTISIMKYQK